MLVYSMTGYASAQHEARKDPATNTPAASTGTIRPSPPRQPPTRQRALPAPAWDWKSARSTADSSISPCACPRNCAPPNLPCASWCRADSSAARSNCAPSSRPGTAKPWATRARACCNAWARCRRACAPGCRPRANSAWPTCCVWPRNSMSERRAQPQDWGTLAPQLTAQALESLLQAREREGARLATMLLGHIAQLRQLTTQASPWCPSWWSNSANASWSAGRRR